MKYPNQKERKRKRKREVNTHLGLVIVLGDFILRNSSPTGSLTTNHHPISLNSTFHFGPDLEKLFPVEGGMEDGDMDAACREGDARDGDGDAEDIDEDAWWG
ncbi:hypothetical protein RHSIM_Rhsim09G0086900 [Rhododendron simsii]|uniref:Uncharacterized protein n=1 Tax=Rhododendron simsii TaxID=118357 RepID=A0A834GJC6_RHOSS|nr:hypothetical protein RHSIM_Rhsim09G0086900 [Rhododendron simsii]